MLENLPRAADRECAGVFGSRAARVASASRRRCTCRRRTSAPSRRCSRAWGRCGGDRHAQRHPRRSRAPSAEDRQARGSGQTLYAHAGGGARTRFTRRARWAAALGLPQPAPHAPTSYSERLIAGDELGEIVHFEAHFDRYRPEVRPRWRETSVPGGVCGMILGPHLVDQALRLFGPPSAVYGDLTRQREGAQAIDYAHGAAALSAVAGHPPRQHARTGPDASFHAAWNAGQSSMASIARRTHSSGARCPAGRGWGCSDARDGVLTTWRNGAPHSRAGTN